MTELSKRRWHITSGGRRATKCDIYMSKCETLLGQMNKGIANLVFADPPFNIGRKYDLYDDDREDGDYLAWCKTWLKLVHYITHRHGTFWLAIGDKYVSELDVMAKSFGFHKRSHVVWAYTFGVNCAKNFTKAHTHLLYYTKSKTRYTFNADDEKLRVPSARQLVYNDKRANVNGRLPDDVWILRQDELLKVFGGRADVWLQSRVCGTFHERIKGFDNQMPLPILERIVAATSNKHDLIVDPFLGTGTTAVAAFASERNFLGMDISKKCCLASLRRVKAL